MPSFRYAGNELRRRRTRTVLTAFGLACGVGLVMGIVGVSDGLDQAQRTVLSPLSSVGTDILVTRTVGATTAASPTPSPSASTSDRRGGFFSGGGPGGGGPGGGGPGGGTAQALSSLNDADATALLNENSSVITDLSKLGKAGTKFTHDFFLAGTMLTFPQQAVDTVKAISGVASATPALTLQAQHQTGTVPNIVASVKTGGETLTTTARPAPLTTAERTALRACVLKNGGFGGFAGGPPASPGANNGGRRQFDLGGFGAIDTCLPARFQEYQAKVITPLRTIEQVVNPPSTDTTTQSWTAAGVDPASPDSGLITARNISSGHWFTGSGQVVVSTTYAAKQKLAVGGSLSINGTAYTVVGLAEPTLTGNTADVYFPLTTLQSVADKSARVNEVLVKVTDASKTAEVAAAIKTALPGAQVVTSKDVADTVTGSLHDAQQLASRLGGALTVIVLLSTFAIAVLLTLSSVQKRVREIGTLRALGWTRRRVVGQVLTETALIGVLGGAVGIGVGYLVSLAVGALSPALSASSTGVAAAGTSQIAQLFGETTSAVRHSVTLTAPISLSTVALGMACALAGGLLAGAVGGWRAARLSPAVALRDLG